MDYQEKFDALTLFYDAFADKSGNKTVLVGPPLLNLEAKLREHDARFYAGEEAIPSALIKMDRCSELHVNSFGSGNVPLYMRGTGLGYSINILPNHCAWFAGRRVLLTMSRNNELTWIRDWVTLNVQRHGADAVLLYDNASTAYPVETLLNTIASVPGVLAAVIVKWPFLYGPQGGNGRPWDSDFAQSGSLQHARRRFLSSARCVLNCDIDELVLPLEGQSVFDF